MPGARIDGVLLQKAAGLGEALIGLRNDNLGPIITVGAGGILAEVYNDVCHRPALLTLNSSPNDC